MTALAVDGKGVNEYARDYIEKYYKAVGKILCGR